jgi:hypothetical protein
MQIRKKFIAVLFLLSIFISTKGVGNSIVNKQLHASLSGSEHCVSQNTVNDDKENISKIKGILELVIKANENSSNNFQNFKNNKKRFNPYLYIQLSLFSKLSYTTYCSTRLNRIASFPLYIAHRKLII